MLFFLRYCNQEMFTLPLSVNFKPRIGNSTDLLTSTMLSLKAKTTIEFKFVQH